ncbi:MAG: type II toxin-antitoxin system HicA family toxin [Hyphomicrobiaceae bacterium]|nr:type II toxin-antitoxin system HicA family toxin [Hyphomicrobiaceae bacterium]
MNPRAARPTGGELISALQRAGFTVVRTKGSHHRLAHADGRKTTVPVHGTETIGPGLLSKILRDVELTREQLEALLQPTEAMWPSPAAGIPLSRQRAPRRVPTTATPDATLPTTTHSILNRI